MRSRKPKDMIKTLDQKGFKELSSKKKSHHKFFYLYHEEKKTDIYTFFSHGSFDYGTQLMTKIKHQLKFTETKTAESFFDCFFSGEQYIKMLQEKGDL